MEILKNKKVKKAERWCYAYQKWYTGVELGDLIRSSWDLYFHDEFSVACSTVGL